MARAWHIANGHLATGEKDGGHVAILLRLEEAQARSLSHTQREVLDQLEYAAMPFLERTSTGAAGLVVTPSGRRRFLTARTSAPRRSAVPWRIVRASRGLRARSARFFASCCATTRRASLACARTSS